MQSTEIWNPLSVTEICEILKNSEFPFWISGGYAIDLFLGKQTRQHDDLDISINRVHQLYFQKQLSKWELKASNPPGSGKLVDWTSEEYLDSPVYNIWAREKMTTSWNFEIMLCDFENDEWVYRRNRNIRGPIHEFDWQTKEGIKVIAPEIQLLYKSRNPREKDFFDFQNCMKIFSVEKKLKLKMLLEADSGLNHPWLKLIF